MAGRRRTRAGPTSLAVGWVAAAAIAALLAALEAGPLTALTAAALSLVVAYRALPSGPATALAAPPAPRWDLPLRMVLTATPLVSLGAAATALGPLAGGILAALPALASVLAVFTHEKQEGAAALAALLRGMLSGMAGFVVFCALVAGLVDRAGITSPPSPRRLLRLSPCRRRPPARAFRADTAPPDVIAEPVFARSRRGG